jgi:hypothetical protein
MTRYTLQIPRDVQRQLGRCRASLRRSIQERLQEIAEGANTAPAGRRRSPTLVGPPLRFYVFEGYRISYQLDPITRSIVVLELRPASS